MTFNSKIIYALDVIKQLLIAYTNDSKFRKYHGWYIDQVQIENDLDNDIYGKKLKIF